MFVAERAGRIRVIENGVTSTFMDISGTVRSDGSERGLLSLAFPPDYATSRKLYAYVTAQTDGRIEVREYTGSDVASMRVLLSVPHDNRRRTTTAASCSSGRTGCSTPARATAAAPTTSTGTRRTSTRGSASC